MKKLLLLIARVIVGGVFIYAGWVKIIDPATFAKDVANYQMLPHAFINSVAIILPWVEVVAGGLMVTGVWLRGSSAVIALLIGVFLVGISQALVRGLDIHCGCFGTVASRKVGFVALGEDLVFLAATVWVWWRAEHWHPSSQPAERIQ